jgi:hypothetical protein
MNERGYGLPRQEERGVFAENVSCGRNDGAATTFGEEAYQLAMTGNTDVARSCGGLSRRRRTVKLHRFCDPKWHLPWYEVR